MTFPVQTFSVMERPEMKFDSQGDACQEAECLHAEHGREFHVTCDGEVCYTSQGAPD